MIDYNEIYDDLSCLLLFFLEDTYLPQEEQNDKITILRYVKTFDKDTLNNTILDFQEVLQLEHFPAEWIGKTTNRWFENSYKTKLWLTNIINLLEAEAKKAGKL